MTFLGLWHCTLFFCPRMCGIADLSNILKPSITTCFFSPLHSWQKVTRKTCSSPMIVNFSYLCFFFFIIRQQKSGGFLKRNPIRGVKAWLAGPGRIQISNDADTLDKGGREREKTFYDNKSPMGSGIVADTDLSAGLGANFA